MKNKIHIPKIVLNPNFRNNQNYVQSSKYKFALSKNLTDYAYLYKLSYILGFGIIFGLYVVLRFMEEAHISYYIKRGIYKLFSISVDINLRSYIYIIDHGGRILLIVLGVVISNLVYFIIKKGKTYRIYKRNPFPDTIFSSNEHVYVKYKKEYSGRYFKRVEFAKFIIFLIKVAVVFGISMAFLMGPYLFIAGFIYFFYRLLTPNYLSLFSITSNFLIILGSILSLTFSVFFVLDPDKTDKFLSKKIDKFSEFIFQKLDSLEKKINKKV